MAWDLPSAPTTGTVITSAWGKQVSDSLAYLKGQAGTIALEDSITNNSGDTVDGIDISEISGYLGEHEDKITNAHGVTGSGWVARYKTLSWTGTGESGDLKLTGFMASRSIINQLGKARFIQTLYDAATPTCLEIASGSEITVADSVEHAATWILVSQNANLSGQAYGASVWA